jgi:hypothetical protein
VLERSFVPGDEALQGFDALFEISLHQGLSSQLDDQWSTKLTAK